MVDSDNRPDNFKTLKICTGTGAITKNLEMPKFVSNHLKNKKIRKNAVKKMRFS